LGPGGRRVLPERASPATVRRSVAMNASQNTPAVIGPPSLRTKKTNRARACGTGLGFVDRFLRDNGPPERPADDRAFSRTLNAGCAMCVVCMPCGVACARTGEADGAGVERVVSTDTAGGGDCTPAPG
jgi:hypothetical protein